MLTAVAISGYRSVHDLVLPLERLNVITGANGSGKSNVYRALRLIAGMAEGGAIRALAREGGLDAVLWAGPEQPAKLGATAQGAMRTKPIALQLGFASDDLGYLVDLGLPVPSESTMFNRDPVIKRESVFAGPVARPSALLVERRNAHVRVRDDSWHDVPYAPPGHRSILSELGDTQTTPELLTLRNRLRDWRFYDHLRTDAEAPARRPQIGTRTPVLSDDGSDLAAALRTIVEDGGAPALDRMVDEAFPGSRIEVTATEGVFTLGLRQQGLLRPLGAAELSDGTLRFLLLVAALLTPQPPELMVLNEPETSLHVDLLPALASLIRRASERTQMVVITHAERLAELLADAPDANLLSLVKRSDATDIDGLGVLERPPWDWGRR